APESMPPMIAKRVLLLIVLLLSFPSTALADSATGLGGSPLNVFVGERGQLQAIRADSGSGIFFDSTQQVGDAGFFLAFPSGLPGDATPQVWGFEGLAGPHGLEKYSPISQTLATGTNPLTQVTTYSAGGVLNVTQTTTYANGSQEFRVRWEVHNASASM